ncbi:hypothetical protein JOF41_007315 [Saccharothrix coeruleofusca]|uniref:hypothetical protein n=1 Tax=Saccharothrix coeruleofusca TaxID=33919 RepID=UPI001AEA06CE|nr:hypothetical protein [Saccharothrix coeruleofusca]MBP2341061.1 hypothetical protein [Saccharothrix coeruleofusca]
MAKPTTLADFEAAHQAAARRVAEVSHREPITPAERVAWCRDLIAAYEQLRQVYRDAVRVIPVRSDKSSDAGLLWNAVWDAGEYCAYKIRDARELLESIQRAFPEES